MMEALRNFKNGVKLWKHTCTTMIGKPSLTRRKKDASQKELDRR